MVPVTTYHVCLPEEDAETDYSSNGEEAPAYAAESTGQMQLVSLYPLADTAFLIPDGAPPQKLTYEDGQFLLTQ